MKIAALIPRSILYPTMGFDIMDGLKASLKQAQQPTHEFDIHNIGVAAKEHDVFAKCEQVLMNGADIVVAYINPGIAEYVHELFASNEKILIVLDSGMHLPPRQKLSHAFFISLEGMTCCRLIARQAVEKGFIKNAFTCSFFDAGYRSPLALTNAALQAGGSIEYNHITALKRSDFTVAPLKNYLDQHEGTGVLAAFCGDMAEDFFIHGAQAGLFSSNAVFASPFTAEEIWLDKIPYPNGVVHTAVTWARNLDNEENRQFKLAMEKPAKANIFSVIAWEAGLIISAINNLSDPRAAINKIESLVLNSPRGKVLVNPTSHYTESPIYNAEIVQSSNGHCEVVMKEEMQHAETERQLLMKDVEIFGDQLNNSWYNAYPCLES